MEFPGEFVNDVIIAKLLVTICLLMTQAIQSHFPIVKPKKFFRYFSALNEHLLAALETGSVQKVRLCNKMIMHKYLRNVIAE